jgi:hypothetical protein
MKVGVEVTGMEEIRKKLRELKVAFPEATKAQLYEEGTRIDANAVPRVPFEFGPLRNSHYVAPPIDEGGAYVVEIGFGTDYAVFVHERTELSHKAPTEAKFLEKAMNAESVGMLERMAKGIEDKAARGVRFGGPAGVPSRPASTEDAKPKSSPGRDSKGRFLPKGGS